MNPPCIAVEPDTRPAMHAAFADAVRAGGGTVTEPERAEAIVWADPSRADLFPEAANRVRELRWVQLPYAGVEPFLEYLRGDIWWTCGKGVYARPVAEHALGLALAGLRGLAQYARATSWGEPVGHNLLGGRVTVLGGGGICRALIELLAPFDAAATVVRRTPEPVPGAQRTLDPTQLPVAVADADVVVVALALTPQTTGIVDREVLAAMAPHAWLVNVARGAHVATADLVDALAARQIGGAALDVTDPEPLPDDHPLWHFPNALITPHIANTPEMGLPLIAARVRENVARYARGADLLGTVDVLAGY